MARKTKTWKLPANLDMTALEDLKDNLLARVDQPELTLNASAVERLSTAAIQLILAAAKTMEAAGGTLNITKPSEAVEHIFSQLGLTQELQTRSK